MNLSQTSTRRLFRQIFGFTYKIQTGHRLRNAAEKARIVHCTSMWAMIENMAAEFMFSWLKLHLFELIYQTTHNSFLHFERPDVIMEKICYSQRVTICVAYWALILLGMIKKILLLWTGCGIEKKLSNFWRAREDSAISNPMFPAHGQN